MRIFIVTNEYSNNGGGLSYSCVKYESLLKSLGHEVEILKSGIEDTSLIHGGYNEHLGIEIASEMKLKTDSMRIRSCDLLIGFGGGFNAYYTALLAIKTNVRYWLLFRGSDANLCKWDADKCYQTKFALSKAERVFALSDEMALNLKNLAGISNVVVIPNHKEREAFIICDISADIIHLGTGATHLNEKKGVRLLIEMVSAYNTKYEDSKISLDLVGKVDEDVLTQYKTLISNLHLEKYVRFLGYMNREDFRSLQKSWDIYIQGSVCEGMGNSIVDSMSLGLPVMLTNTGYVSEVAEVHYPEILFNSFYPDSMAKQLHSLIKDPNRKIKFERFYNHFFNLVSMESIRKKWECLLVGNLKPKLEIQSDTIISVSLHEVDGMEHDNITTPISVFENFAKRVFEMGYRLCSMSDYILLDRNSKKASIVCTFDDGYTGLYENALSILNKYGFTATVFVCYNYIGQSNDWNFKDKKSRAHLSVDQLKELQKNGWEIGSHGLTHRSLLRLNDDEVRRELKESKTKLEQLFGPIISYAYPYGDYSSFIMSQVEEFYKYAFLLTQGGVFLNVDALRIHRYYISEIYQIISAK